MYLNYQQRKRLERDHQRKQARRQQIYNNIFQFIVYTLALYGYMDILLRANGL